MKRTRSCAVSSADEIETSHFPKGEQAMERKKASDFPPEVLKLFDG